MVNAIPGVILGLREGLEAFLIVSVMLKYVDKIGRLDLKRPIMIGMGIGVGGSLALGLALWGAVFLMEGSGENVGKLWESLASVVGLALLSSFILWMMKHGKTVTADVQKQVDARMSGTGIASLAAVVVLREGAEISLFAFSAVDERAYVVGIAAGVVISAVLACLIFLALVRVNVGALFAITLAYLVLQAGYLLGYSVHEFLSALKGLGRMAPESWVYVKAFDFAATVLDHRSGAFGLLLNVLVGWYSRPEWIQAFLHYGYVAAMLLLWRRMAVRRG